MTEFTLSETKIYVGYIGKFTMVGLADKETADAWAYINGNHPATVHTHVTSMPVLVLAKSVSDKP